jgi:hypothetical protein
VLDRRDRAKTDVESALESRGGGLGASTVAAVNDRDADQERYADDARDGRHDRQRSRWLNERAQADGHLVDVWQES